MKLSETQYKAILAREGYGTISDTGKTPQRGIQRRKNKYNATRREIDGHVFDSLAEARRYEELKLLQRDGQIHNLILQPKYLLLRAFTDKQGRKHRAVSYKGDFEYIENGQTVCEDTKGVETALFRAKWKFAIRKFPHIEFRKVRR